jgi:voltage-gated potassium channel
MRQPESSSTAPSPAPPRRANILLRKPLTTARAVQIIAYTTVFAALISGLLMHFTDKKTYPNVGDGLWWAIQTVTTVGYGDLVPTSTTGRLIAALVMVVGIGFLTVTIAAITSAFVESARRRLEGAQTDALSTKLDGIGTRLDAIEASLKIIGEHDRDAPK